MYSSQNSSCNCYNCTENKYENNQNFNATNMGVSNCNTPKQFECYDRIPFGTEKIQPDLSRKGFPILNPQCMVDKYSKDFGKTINQMGQTVYGSNAYDGRLVSVPHGGQVTFLDRPPLTGKPKDGNLSLDKSLDNYGQFYRTYKDIKEGDITYYFDESRIDPYYNPLFTISSKVTKTLFKDPMGSVKPEYGRTPLVNRDMMNTTRDNYQGGLSSIMDSNSHREDIMAKQMVKINQSRWEPRWANNM